MKKITISFFALASILFLACSNSSGNDTQTANSKKTNEKTLKRYGVKSGIVKYKLTINGKIMGGEVSGSGTKELYFKNWGAKELVKEDSKQVTKINIFGQKKTDVSETHNIDKLDNGKSYSVDTKNKVIYVKDDPAMEMVKMFNNGDAEEVGKQLLESMGGKQIGKEKYKGYMCEVWEIPGGKQWIYKGVPLKLEMNLMGVHTIQEATEAKFDINVPEKYFELPNYPLQEMETGYGGGFTDDDKDEIKNNVRQIKKMSYEEYKKMLKENDPDAAQMSEEQIKASYNLMQKMAQAMGN
jgi:hypothetical protein